MSWPNTIAELQAQSHERAEWAVLMRIYGCSQWVGEREDRASLGLALSAVDLGAGRTLRGMPKVLA